MVVVFLHPHSKSHLVALVANVFSANPNAVLNLLAVEYAETDKPAGVVTLVFSGGAALRLEVECLEVELADLGPVWVTAACPCHLQDAS